MSLFPVPWPERNSSISLRHEFKLRPSNLTIAVNEFQSNAAFNLYQNPRYHYRRPVVLPPSLMYGQETRTFWCAINGTASPFEISVHVDVKVNGLKKKIKEEMVLHDVAASNLVLWKVYYYYLLAFPL